MNNFCSHLHPSHVTGLFRSIRDMKISNCSYFQVKQKKKSSTSPALPPKFQRKIFIIDIDLISCQAEE